MAVCAWQLQNGWELAATLVLGAALLALAAEDWHSYRLPRRLTVPLGVLGLAVSFAIDPELLPHHAVGVIVGFALIAGLNRLYAALRGRDGLGGGDADLLAAAGAWVGWQGLPTILIIAALAGLCHALVRARLRNRSLTRLSRLPFGPSLALGIWITWLLGPLQL